MGKINYVIGDATEPQGNGTKIIVHVVNDIGVWGKGFVMALSAKWKEPEIMYRKFRNYDLGNVQYVKVSNNICVANLVGQHLVGRDEYGNPPVRYSAIRDGLNDINKVANMIGATIHAPMFGAGLSGGNWTIIEDIINNEITVPITIYVLNKKDLPQNII